MPRRAVPRDQPRHFPKRSMRLIGRARMPKTIESTGAEPKRSTKQSTSSTLCIASPDEGTIGEVVDSRSMSKRKTSSSQPFDPMQAPSPGNGSDGRVLSVFEMALLIEWRRAKGWLPG